MLTIDFAVQFANPRLTRVKSMQPKNTSLWKYLALFVVAAAVAGGFFAWQPLKAIYFSGVPKDLAEPFVCIPTTAPSITTTGARGTPSWIGSRTQTKRSSATRRWTSCRASATTWWNATARMAAARRSGSTGSRARFRAARTRARTVARSAIEGARAAERSAWSVRASRRRFAPPHHEDRKVHTRNSRA